MEAAMPPVDVDLNALRSVRELDTEKRRLTTRLETLNAQYRAVPFSAEAREEFAGLKETIDEIDNRIHELEGRQRMMGVLAQRSQNVEPGDGAGAGDVQWRSASEHPDPRLRADFSAALRAIDQCTTLPGFSDRAATRVEHMLRATDNDGLDSRYLAAVGNPDYASAF